MILFVLAYLGGVLTIVSPCILPVLPFVFARSDKPFVSSGLPMLAGMATTFAGVATLAAVGGGWAVQANEYGRVAAIALLALFGVTLLFPALSDRLTRPVVALGSRLSEAAGQGVGVSRSTVWSSLLLGVATGLLWAPCAGPILGLILTGAALHGASAETSLLLAAYAAGAATSLALALLIGGRVFTAMKRSLGTGEWIRRGLGVAVLGGVAVITLGLDTSLLTQISLARTASLEQGLVDKLRPAPEARPLPLQTEGGDAATGGLPTMTAGSPPVNTPTPPAMEAAGDLPVEGEMPSLSGAVAWLNSPPLTAEELKGKVVLVDFWTYSCINCLRSLPYVRAWAEKYKDLGLVVIGVHTPEFAFEKNIDNVKKAIADLKISFPVAIDNDYTIWRAFKNRYWPADYFIDAQGRIRDHTFGEGDYEASEQVIQRLLAQAGRTNVFGGLVAVHASGAEAATGEDNARSPETYLGYARAENFVSPGGAVRNTPHIYAAGMPKLNEWGLSGNWTIGDERAVLNRKEGSIVFKFHARDLHLVLGSATHGSRVRFLVTIDGKPPGDSHGTDVDSQGEGAVTGQRLYQLVRQNGTISDHTFEIRFLDSGVEAYAFTFG
jgi:cytochrome c biogenesis protein CcdA/thiol-disulfide isomerase/thioredoxin